MPAPHQLFARLEAIGQSLATTERALALIGLGSVGSEHYRLDQYSDLDFFVVVSTGAKAAFLDGLAWLATPAALTYVFRNTPDGYKVLSADGIFYEFAVFEPSELRTTPVVADRLVWHAPHVDESFFMPREAMGEATAPSAEWLLGEALTNLYVGLGRYHRGEKLSAMRFIQQYAVDRVLELAVHLEGEPAEGRDPYAPERRYEQRVPAVAQQLPLFLQGYERSPESARAIMEFLAQHFAINPAIADAIRTRY